MVPQRSLSDVAAAGMGRLLTKTWRPLRRLARLMSSLRPVTVTEVTGLDTLRERKKEKKALQKQDGFHFTLGSKRLISIPKVYFEVILCGCLILGDPLGVCVLVNGLAGAVLLELIYRNGEKHRKIYSRAGNKVGCLALRKGWIRGAKILMPMTHERGAFKLLQTILVYF